MSAEFVLSVILATGEFESNNNDHAVGKAGERSRYQITHATWREHTHIAFSKATDPVVSKMVCSNIVIDIIRRHRAKTAYDVYCIYNGGYGGRHLAEVQLRAKRFQRLWDEKYKSNR